MITVAWIMPYFRFVILNGTWAGHLTVTMKIQRSRHVVLWALLLLVTLPALARPLKVDHILVLKQKHELRLLRGSKIVKSYRIALGSGGLAPKRREGDHRTPEGSYRVDSRNPTSRFHLALHLSYPEQADKERAQKLGVDPGGNIEIHGLGKEFKSLGTRHYRSDWTDGCIAVTDSEIEEIWRLVPDGTSVEILP
jgi:murein L,D-transpeptidase YafK